MAPSGAASAAGAAGSDPALLPCSVQLPGHVTLGVGDSSGAVPSGPAHPGDPGLQPPLRLHRQAALQAPLL